MVNLLLPLLRLHVLQSFKNTLDAFEQPFHALFELIECFGPKIFGPASEIIIGEMINEEMIRSGPNGLSAGPQCNLLHSFFPASTSNVIPDP